MWLTHSAIQQELTQHRKATIPSFFKKKGHSTVQYKVIIALTRPQEKLNLIALCFHDTAEKAVPLNWKESFLGFFF